MGTRWMGEAVTNSAAGSCQLLGVPLEGIPQLGQDDAHAADVRRGIVTEELQHQGLLDGGRGTSLTSSPGRVESPLPSVGIRWI